ncbi:nibrin isoform X2 [Ambystoma mexicanum]|uniref:nibrin isoform X2 n=1 Tax=Ambystoma mexicanum TaxID=8296 RepID=UPI0037E95923
MWQLVATSGAGEPYRFLIGTDYVVGRKNCAILIQDDQSISRAHATFTVSHPQTNLSRCTALPVLTVKDSSKYGTFINGEKLLTDSQAVLKSGDQVTCGVFNSKFRVEYEPLVTCSSCLDGPGKSALNQAVLQLGGHVVNNWTNECTHLVMNSVKVTIKTICALICMRPVVKPEYFNELVKAIQMKQPLPTPESFHPPVDEPSINSDLFDLSGRQERRSIFSRKTFLFLNAKQHKKLSPAVILGGGEAKLVHEGTKDISPLLDNTATCVIDAGYASSQLSICETTKEWIDSTTALLQSKGLRAIPEAEIGLAVVFMSTETYCNPQSNHGEESTAESRVTISAPTLSESMAIDETIMPAPTFNTTAYVANTEAQDQPDTWMDVSGVQEVKETPRINRKGKVNIQDITTAKESPSTSSLGKADSSLFGKERKSATEQKSQHLLPPSGSRLSKNKDKSSQHQADLMKNYFQVTAKKRERDDDEKELSAPKLAKTTDKSLNFSEDDLLITTPQCGKSVLEQSTKKGFAGNSNSISLSEELSQKPGHRNGKKVDNKTVAKMSSSEIPGPKKRKELEIFARSEEFEKRLMKEDNASDMGDQSPEDGISNRKKRRLDSVDNKVKEEDITIVTNFEKLEEDSDTLPSRLLLTEFRSLIVSNQTYKRNFTERKDNGNTVNYKKFKKVSYPGAGGFPNIIGGSDLIAHHTKKNSEMELWLRDEMEKINYKSHQEDFDNFEVMALRRWLVRNSGHPHKPTLNAPMRMTSLNRPSMQERSHWPMIYLGTIPNRPREEDELQLKNLFFVDSDVRTHLHLEPSHCAYISKTHNWHCFMQSEVIL